MVQPSDFSACYDHKPLIMKDDEKVANNIDVVTIIENVLKALGVNAPTFSKKVGVNYQRIFDLQRGRTKKFNPGMVTKITEAYPQINKHYLYSGEGPVLLDVPDSELNRNSSMNSNNLSEFVGMSSKILDLFEQLQEKDRELSGKASLLLQKESQLNERERMLNEREHNLNTREHELSRLAITLEKDI